MTAVKWRSHLHPSPRAINQHPHPYNLPSTISNGIDHVYHRPSGSENIIHNKRLLPSPYTQPPTKALPSPTLSA